MVLLCLDAFCFAIKINSPPRVNLRLVRLNFFGCYCCCLLNSFAFDTHSGFVVWVKHETTSTSVLKCDPFQTFFSYLYSIFMQYPEGTEKEEEEKKQRWKIHFIDRSWCKSGMCLDVHPCYKSYFVMNQIFGMQNSFYR